MNFNFLEEKVDRLLRVTEEDKKADMQLPVRIAYFGIAMTFAGLVLVILSLITRAWSMLIFAGLAFLVAAFAFLCYKFRRIHVLSATEFSYTNFWGRKRIYNFDHIRGVRMSSESHTLIMNLGRIRIETANILSDRLKALFNKELNRIHRENEERKNRKKALKAQKKSITRRINNENNE